MTREVGFAPELAAGARGGHGGALIGGGSNALHDVSGNVASIDLVDVAPS
jgi:hypothetical protein